MIFCWQLFLYCIYYLMILAIHVVLISVVAFFHFLLDYNLSVIEEWIFDHGWSLIMISKCLALYLIMLFITTKDHVHRPLFNVIQDKMMLPSREMLVVTVFAFIFLVVQGNPVFATLNEMSFGGHILAILGIHVFFLTDLMFLYILQHYYPLDRRWIIGRIFVFPLVLALVMTFTYLYSTEMSHIHLFYLGFLIYIMQIYDDNWGNLLCFITPTSTWMVLSGLDPVWGGVYSPIILRSSVGPFHFIILGFIIFGYFTLKRKNFYYIFKDRLLTLLDKRF